MSEVPAGTEEGPGEDLNERVSERRSRRQGLLQSRVLSVPLGDISSGGQAAGLGAPSPAPSGDSTLTQTEHGPEETERNLARPETWGGGRGGGWAGVP